MDILLALSCRNHNNYSCRPSLPSGFTTKLKYEGLNVGSSVYIDVCKASEEKKKLLVGKIH